MKYKAILNKKGYIDYLEENGNVEVDLEETRKHPLFCFKVVDDKAIYDEEEYHRFLLEEEQKRKEESLKPTVEDLAQALDILTDIVLGGE